MNIFLGILGIVLSLLVIIYRQKIKAFMGPIAWAEARFGPGGTYTALLLLGVLGFFLSLMVMTDSFGFLLGGWGVDFFGATK